MHAQIAAFGQCLHVYDVCAKYNSLHTHFEYMMLAINLIVGRAYAVFALPVIHIVFYHLIKVTVWCERQSGAAVDREWVDRIQAFTVFTDIKYHNAANYGRKHMHGVLTLNKEENDHRVTLEILPKGMHAVPWCQS